MTQKKPLCYVAYLPDPERHSNAAAFHAGIGSTKEKAFENAMYWANQLPWVRIVAASRAPQWAVDEALEDLEFRRASVREYAGDLDPEGRDREIAKEDARYWDAVDAWNADAARLQADRKKVSA